MFKDRRDAGRQLAEKLTHLRDEHPVVVGLPRGGIPVAFEIAQALDAPLDVIVARKLGVPSQPELGFGAVGEGGVLVLNRSVVQAAGLVARDLELSETHERAEVDRRARHFRRGRVPVSLTRRTVIVVDDGVATGGTARAALEVARASGASRVVLAVPVASAEALQSLKTSADEVVCLETPAWFRAVGQWYLDFEQTTDEEVAALLAAGDPGDRAASTN